MNDAGEDLEAFGAPADVVEKTGPKEIPFEVWRENWRALQLFLRMQTQWNYGAMSGATGLNYQSLETLFRIYKVKNKRKMLEDIQIIEVGALKEMNAQQKDK